MSTCMGHDAQVCSNIILDVSVKVVFFVVAILFVSFLGEINI